MPVTTFSRLVDRGIPDPGMVGGVGERITRVATDQVFPLRAELRQLLPWRGLRRGATVAVAAGGPGVTSLLFTLIAEPVHAGSWCGVVGVPAAGAAAAAELGVDLRQLVLVPDPGPEWATVVAALLDGLDIVVVRPPGLVASPLERRLAARARQRGSVLVPYGEWQAADVVLRATGQVWHGLGMGRGRLGSRELNVVSYGRGAAARPRSASVWLPSVGPTSVDPAPGNPTLAGLQPIAAESSAAPGATVALTLVRQRDTPLDEAS